MSKWLLGLGLLGIGAYILLSGGKPETKIVSGGATQRIPQIVTLGATETPTKKEVETPSITYNIEMPKPDFSGIKPSPKPTPSHLVKKTVTYRKGVELTKGGYVTVRPKKEKEIVRMPEWWQPTGYEVWTPEGGMTMIPI